MFQCWVNLSLTGQWNCFDLTHIVICRITSISCHQGKSKIAPVCWPRSQVFHTHLDWTELELFSGVSKIVIFLFTNNVKNAQIYIKNLDFLPFFPFPMPQNYKIYTSFPLPFRFGRPVWNYTTKRNVSQIIKYMYTYNYRIWWYREIALNDTRTLDTITYTNYYI